MEALPEPKMLTPNPLISSTFSLSIESQAPWT